MIVPYPALYDTSGMDHASSSSEIMKVAIPIWDGRISPLMDTARRLLVAEIDEGQVVSKETVGLPRADIPGHVSFLTNRHIDILICGAISHQLERMLAASGIRSYPWVRGEVGEVIAAYCNGVLQNDNFLLPGCGRRRCRGGGRGRGGRRGLGRGRMSKEEL